MRATEFDLQRLLSPVQEEEFFRDSWEQKPLAVSRDDAAFYRGLFALADVDSVIAYTRPKFLEPGDLEGGTPKSHPFVQGWLPDNDPLQVPFYPDVAQLRKAFGAGKTVIITAMEHRWGPVAAMCRRLEVYFGCPVHTNLYLTPPGAQGFEPHFDTHEVFVLQIEGTKHWRFYGPARELPLADERFTIAREQLGPPSQEAKVRPGDLLYMPRGHVHEAFTSDSLSLHLTVGIKVFRWTDLVGRALADLSARDANFRKSLPSALLTGAEPPDALERQFRGLLQALAADADLSRSVQGMAADFVSKLAPLPCGYFAEVDAESVVLESVLERAPGALCWVAESEGGRVTLHFPGGKVEGPSKIASALRYVARNSRFAVQSLPDELADSAKLVLARRLVRDRLLTVARDPQAPIDP